MFRTPDRRFPALLFLIVLAGCGEQDLIAPAPLEADRLHGLIGSGPQPAVVGEEVTNRPGVVARNPEGRSVPGVLVRFEVTVGGGELWPDDPIETDASGVARVGSWAVGPVPGENEVVATLVDDPGATAVFRAIASPGEAIPAETSLAADPRLGLAADGRAESIVTLRARDRFGNAVPGRRMYLWVLEGSEDAVILGARSLVTGADGNATTTLRSTEPGLVRLGVFGEDDPDGPEFGATTAIFVDG